jgi:hypothetical protein
MKYADVELNIGWNRIQPVNTEFYATLADNGSVVEGTSIWLQYKQSGNPQLWTLWKLD